MTQREVYDCAFSSYELIYWGFFSQGSKYGCKNKSDALWNVTIFIARWKIKSIKKALSIHIHVWLSDMKNKTNANLDITLWYTGDLIWRGEKPQGPVLSSISREFLFYPSLND